MGEETPKEILIVGYLAILAMLTMLAWGAWGVMPNSIRYPLLYSFLTPAEFHNIQVDPKPHDCDWDYAPIGNKGCHYETNIACAKDAPLGKIGVEPEKCSTEAKYVYVLWRKVQD